MIGHEEIEKMELDDLKAWLQVTLEGGNPSPLPLIEDRPHPSWEYAYSVYINTMDENFQKRLFKAVKDLFIRGHEALHSDIENTFYYDSLIHLIAILKVEDTADIIRNKVLSGNYIGKPKNRQLVVHAFDMQHHLLRTLLEFNPDKQNIEAFKKFFSSQEGRYATVCYRGLWENDRSYGLKKLPELANLHLSTKPRGLFVSFLRTFENFLEHYGIYFMEEFDNQIPICSKVTYDFILNSINEVGLYYRPLLGNEDVMIIKPSEDDERFKGYNKKIYAKVTFERSKDFLDSYCSKHYSTNGVITEFRDINYPSILEDTQFNNEKVMDV